MGAVYRAWPRPPLRASWRSSFFISWLVCRRIDRYGGGVQNHGVRVASPLNRLVSWSLFPSQRQRDGEDCAVRRGAFRLDAAVRAGDRTRDGEPQSEASASSSVRFVRPIESTEDMREIGF